LNYLICPKCNEMNAGSAIFCSTCGESLKSAKLIEPSDKAYVKSKDNAIGAETPKEVSIVFIMGAFFIFFPTAVLLSAKDYTHVVQQAFCALPILFGVGLIVAGIDMIRRPERYSKKPSADAATARTETQVKCSVCNRTNADYLRDLKRKDPNMYIISSAFIGTCPVCKKAYCVEHAAFDGNIDHEVCPVHKEKLIVV
jgi:hypothetical protein